MKNQSNAHEDVSDDGFKELLPARRGFLDCLECYHTGPTSPWRVIYGYGSATDEQKRAALNTLHRGDDRLNRDYFLSQDSHEIWVGSKLIGLCNLQTSVSEIEDETVCVNTTLNAIFILKRYRGHGMGSMFIQAILKDLRAGYTAEISASAKAGAKKFLVILYADFESEEGAGVFANISVQLEDLLDPLKVALNVEIECIEDAGF
jgi:predicted acetyltransferase